MTRFKPAAAAAAIALALGATTAARAAVRLFDFTVYDTASGLAGAGGPAGGGFGTVKVEDFGTNALQFTVDLANGYGFQNVGANQTHDAFAFDLTGGPAVAYSFQSPVGGAFDTSNATPDTFTGGPMSLNAYGDLGWSPGYDFGVQVHNRNHDNYLFGAQNNEVLIFTVATSCNGVGCVAPALSVNSLGSETVLGKSVFFSADISGAPGGFATGPVGAVERMQMAVPEPEAWTLMILGFGGVGGALRAQRRRAAALRA